MNKENNWWIPEKLIEKEMMIREIVDISKLDGNNDFGSYRKILLSGDTKNSLIEQHNDLNPLNKIRVIHKLLDNKKPRNILDAGCGIGYTAEALAKFYSNAKVLGVDISKDAIEFAKKKHTKAQFISQVIAPDSKKIGTFDLIFCFEFYPFTRNKDSNIHAEYINYFSQQLNVNGCIIIYQKWEYSTIDSSVINIIKNKKNQLSVSVIKIPNPKLSKFFPGKLGLFFINILENIFKRNFMKKIIIIKKI